MSQQKLKIFFMLIGMMSLINFQNCSGNRNFTVRPETKSSSLDPNWVWTEEIIESEDSNSDDNTNSNNNSNPNSPSNTSTQSGTGSVGIIDVPGNEILNPVCGAGKTYDGEKCVPFKAVCNSYVELSGASVLVPARNSSGTCYYIKMVNYQSLKNSSKYPSQRFDIMARAHDSSTVFPRIMGEGLISSLRIEGEREIILSSSPRGDRVVKVDNFLLVETSFADNSGNPVLKLFGQGTADAPRSGRPLLVNEQEVFYVPGKNGGTDIFDPIDLQAFVPTQREVSVRVSALDCGSVGETSDIYILFK